MSDRKPDLTLPLWPEGVPGKLADGAEDNPWLELYRAPNPTGAAILVLPGGGYQNRAPHEAGVIAEWLNTLGIAGVVVHYRVKPYKHPQPMNDASRAIRIARQNAAAWGIDAGRVGILGFSAGGHLASTLSNHYEADTRPDISIVLYPVITLTAPSAHTGSRANLLVDPNDPRQIEALSNEKHVTFNTPPTFLFHTADDGAVPVENALLYLAALRANKVPFEGHIYEHGRHGVGLAVGDPVLGTWPMLCANWLRTRNFAR